ncbi:MAG: hypothetical protein KDJ45_04025 [Hyphomicrobiaceae bacterium]|nr:hypothetical protein [Hyphomicrobiaceae bacterium]MCC0011306.1 hypothetical protein [Hyphomicrobiaceae bacterium]
MLRLTDNERAMLELLVETPRSYFPPMHQTYARSLSQQGLAVHAKDGHWYITAAGVRETARQLH